MALLTLLFSKEKVTQIGVMQLDASLNEVHSRTAQVTQHAIEDGSNIADHVLVDPIKLSLTGIVSSTPLTLKSSIIGLGVTAASDVIGDTFGGIGQTAAAIGAGSLAGLVNSNQSLNAEEQVERPDGSIVTRRAKNTQDAFNYLEELYKNRRPFTVITGLKQYSNMIITNLNVPKNASVGDSLQFTIDLEQVTIVQSSIVKIDQTQIINDSKNRGQGTTKIGKQPTSELNEDSKTASNSTILFDLIF